MVNFSSKRAQSTIEYLVIIAVVITISLAVTGVTTNIVGNQNVSGVSQKVGLQTSIIPISGLFVGGDANGLVVIKNNEAGSILVEHITIDGIDHNYSNARVFSGEVKSFKLVNLTACSSGKTIFDLKIKYFSIAGLEKTLDYGRVNFDCTQTIIPNGTYFDENNTIVAQTFSEKYSYLYLNTDFTTGTFSNTELVGTNVGVGVASQSLNNTSYLSPVIDTGTTETSFVSMKFNVDAGERDTTLGVQYRGCVSALGYDCSGLTSDWSAESFNPNTNIELDSVLNGNGYRYFQFKASWGGNWVGVSSPTFKDLNLAYIN